MDLTPSPATHHFLAQRLSAMLLVPLGFWFLSDLKGLNLKAAVDVVTWIQKPRTTLFFIVFIGCLFYHAFLGIQVVLEDYIANLELRHQAIHLTRWLFMGAAGICTVFILMLFAFGMS